jgi:hypothetical protein
MQGANPTLRQRALGIRLRELRTGLGLTIEDVAEELLCSVTKISRLEAEVRVRGAPPTALGSTQPPITPEQIHRFGGLVLQQQLVITCGLVIGLTQAWLRQAGSGTP